MSMMKSFSLLFSTFSSERSDDPVETLDASVPVPVSGVDDFVLLENVK